MFIGRQKLRAWGHDVITARELAMQRASDEELLIEAQQTSCLLVTRDKDYGALVCGQSTHMRDRVKETSNSKRDCFRMMEAGVYLRHIAAAMDSTQEQHCQTSLK
jgi:hypothetical protein